MNRQRFAFACLLFTVTAIAAAAGQDDHEAENGAAKHTGEDTHAENEVHLTEAQRAKLTLEIARAKAGSVSRAPALPATVRFDPDRVARVGPRLRAKVVEVVKDLGERVEAGDTVAVMDSVALGKAKARYLTAQATLETAKADYERQKTLAEQQISSQAELLEARARFREARARRDAVVEELRLYGLSRQQVRGIEAGTEQPLSRYRLTSPIAGVVQRRDVTVGQTVEPTETPIHVVDTRRVWVMLEAYEPHLPLLEPGLEVTFRSRALPERTFTGKTDWVSRELDEQTRTVRVRAVVDNADGLLRAGMFGQTAVATGAGDAKAAMVPVDAVQTLKDRPVVFVPGDKAGAFRAVPVTLGEESASRVEILSGLQPGDRLVVSGAFDLKSALTAHSH